MQPNKLLVPTSDLTLRIALECFFRQRRLFLWVFTVVLLATLAATLLMRRQYLSEMKFIVQNTRENIVVTAERTTPQNILTGVTEEQVNSELEVLRSHDVIDPVADPTWDSLPASQRTPEAVRRHARLVATFDKKLGTEIVRKTNVINVSYLASSPEEARDALNKLSASYLAELRGLQRPPGASTFFVSEAERARQAWDAATQELVAFQRNNQIVSLPDRETMLDSQITEGNDDSFTTDTSLHELDAQIAEGQRRLNEMPARQLSQDRSSPNEQLVGQLDTLVVQLQNRRTDLVTNYKPTDRAVRDLDQQITSAKSALSDAESHQSHEQTMEIDPAWQQIHTNYVENQITREALLQHKARGSSRMSSLQQDLAHLEELTTQYNNLQAREEELKANYDLYTEKRDQAQAEDAMDEHKLLNVAVAQEPTLAYQPERPKPVMYAGLGLVTALFLGMICVYLIETSRTTFATPRELDVSSRYPVLATVPHMTGLASMIALSELRATDEYLT